MSGACNKSARLIGWVMIIQTWVQTRNRINTLEALLKQAIADKKKIHSQYMVMKSQLAKANSRRDKLQNEIEKYMRSFPYHSLTESVKRKIEAGEL